MSRYTRDDIIQMVEEEDVEFIRLQFTDMEGVLKNVAITKPQLEKALDNKCVFDCSFIDSYAGDSERDMFLYPDLDTFTIFPWRPQTGKVARIICDIYHSDKKPFESDGRYVLKKVISQAREMGYELNVGMECEFFLFDIDENGCPTTSTTETAGYFDLGPTDTGENTRRDIVMTLEDMDFMVDCSHHAAAPGQQEIDLNDVDALQAADDMVTFKLAVKTIARRHGKYATFMPKPSTNQNGSGLHLQLFLSDIYGKNVFHDSNDKYNLSQEAYYFMGGIMKHIKGMTAILNPTINSYKRIVPGFEAPSHIAWSGCDRNRVIRVPQGYEDSARIELRSADMGANPYLGLALILAAGLEGIKNQIMPPEEVRGDIRKFTKKELHEGQIESLPISIRAAIEELEKDDFLCQILGEELLDNYSKTKISEWERYRTHVTDWEVNEYLGKY